MKNFNLLLGATALLSTAFAMGVKAANPTETMNASIEVIVVDNFDVIEDLNFGTWIVPSNKSSVTFSMDGQGNLTAEDAELAIGGDGWRGMVDGVPCDRLSFPSTVKFSNTPRSTASGILSGFGAVDNNTSLSSSSYSCAVYATSLVIADSGEGGIKSGEYSGSFTITAVLENDK